MGGETRRIGKEPDHGDGAIKDDSSACRSSKSRLEHFECRRPILTVATKDGASKRRNSNIEGPQVEALVRRKDIKNFPLYFSLNADPFTDCASNFLASGFSGTHDGSTNVSDLLLEDSVGLDDLDRLARFRVYR